MVACSAWKKERSVGYRIGGEEVAAGPVAHVPAVETGRQRVDALLSPLGTPRFAKPDRTSRTPHTEKLPTLSTKLGGSVGYSSSHQVRSGLPLPLLLAQQVLAYLGGRGEPYRTVFGEETLVAREAPLDRVDVKLILAAS